MKSKKTIIIASIIFILIACVSVSYAYFTANIVGNETANPVHLKSGLLELTYRDGNNINANPVVPSWSQTKTVEIENTGKKSVTYKIILDPLLNEIQNDELVFSATCKQYLVDENNGRTETGTCDDISPRGVPVNTVANPIELPYTLAGNINIDKNYLHIYTMKFEFIEIPTPQDYNQDKLFNGTINVMESILWYETAANYPNRLTSRMLSGGSQPNDTIVMNNTKPNIKLMATLGETALYYTTDTNETQDGSRVYYYRGNTEENHVIFAGICWRIVRTNVDGSVRMRYNGTPSSGTCPVKGTQVSAGTSEFNSCTNCDNRHVGYMYGNTCTSYETCHANKVNSTIKTFVDNWYNTNIGNNSNYDNMVAISDFCNDRSLSNNHYSGVGIGSTVYSAYSRLHSGMPTYKCPQINDIFEEKVGLLTADEVMFAGGSFSSNTSYYLHTNNCYRLMTPVEFEMGNAINYDLNSSGALTDNYLFGCSYVILPVISLKADTMASSGLGTSSSPWIVD